MTTPESTDSIRSSGTISPKAETSSINPSQKLEDNTYTSVEDAEVTEAEPQPSSNDNAPTVKRKVGRPRKKGRKKIAKDPIERIQSNTLEESPSIREKPRVQNAPKISGVIQRGGEKIFVEPEPAEPRSVYTGLPLEAFPSTKIKKESLWPNKNPTRKIGRPSAKDIQTPSNDITDEIERRYKASLKTELSAERTELSESRQPTKVVKRGRPKLTATKSVSKTPQQIKRREREASSPYRSSKRIKVISPRKSTSTNLAPSSVTDSISSYEPQDESTKDNEDFCSSCGLPGIFICCDSCPKSFHFTCCNPPLEDCTDEYWHCTECTVKKDPTSIRSWNHMGIFGPLLNHQETSNPYEFRLPKNLRDNTFIGVKTGINGSYEDITMKPEMSQSKINGAQLFGYNKNEDLEIESFYDKNGDPYLCHKCGSSGLKNKTLTHCDYCNLVWHLDCLEEPLVVPKTIGSKWRCPAHWDNLTPFQAVQTRRFKNATTMDASLYNGFLKMASLSDILIKHSDQNYFKSNSFPTLNDYLQYQDQDFSRAALSHGRSLEDKDNQLDDAVNSSFKIPDFFQSYSTPNGVASHPSSSLGKVLTLTNENEGNINTFIYRIPEKSLILDFINKVRKKDVIDMIEEYEAISRYETVKDDKLTVDSLTKMKTELKPKMDLDELVKVALNESEHEIKESAQSPIKVELDPSEISDLLKVKKLIELKGKEKLMHFLQS